MTVSGMESDLGIPKLVFWSSGDWLLHYDTASRLKILHKGHRLYHKETVEIDITSALKIISKTEFQNCFRKRKYRSKRIAQSNGDYFEVWQKIILALRNGCRLDNFGTYLLIYICSFSHYCQEHNILYFVTWDILSYTRFSLTKQC